MRKNDNIPDGLKTFCHTVWIFAVTEIIVYLLSSLYWEFSMGGWFYDLLCLIFAVFWHFSCVVSPVWLIITITWCGVIAKKENNKKIFFYPAVVITNVISIIYICIFATI